MKNTFTALFLFIAAIASSQIIYPTSQAASNPFLHPKEVAANREIVLIYDSNIDNNYFTNHKFYDVNTLSIQDLNTNIALNTNMPIYNGIQNRGNRHIGQATGDFNNDGKDDYVVATEGTGQTIELRTYGAQAIAANLTVVPGASGSNAGPLNNSSSSGESRAIGWMKLACGDFNGDGDDEFALCFRNHNTSLLSIQFYDIENNAIVLKGEIADEQLDVIGTGSSAFESFDIITADLDYDGNFEVLLAATQNNGGSRQPFVKVYDVNAQNGNLIALPRDKKFIPTTQSPNSRMTVALATGDFNNDLVYEIALAYGFMINNNSGSNPDTFIRMFRVGDDSATVSDEEDFLETLELLPSVFSTTKSVNAMATLEIDAGDMDGNGSDDLVLATGTDIEAFFIDQNFNFSSQGGVGTFSNAVDTEYDQYLAVADMNLDGRAEIVNVRNWQFDNGSGGNPLQRFSIVVHRWNTTTGQFVQLAANDNQMEAPGYTSGDQRQFVIGIGDFDGDEIRFGNFSYRIIEDVQEPLLILNAPPTHQDNIGPADWIDVNGQFTGSTNIECGPSIASYETTQGSSVTVSSTYNTAWSVGASLGAEFDFLVASINASISTTYEQSSSVTNATTQTVTVNNTYNTCFDDAIYAATLQYEVYEYPIYAADTLVTYLISIRPLPLSFGWVQNRSNAANSYLPSHEPGNLLSYRRKPQVGSNLGMNNRFGFLSYNAPQGNEQSWSITTASSAETTAETSYNVGVETSASASAFGVTLGVTGTYDFGQTSLRTMNVSDELSIGASVAGTVLNTNNYSANAVLFWGDGGALTLDYEVNPSGTFYMDNYSQQDPALNMPWRLDQQRGLIVEDPTALFQCKSISLSKKNPEPGDTVVVSVRIYNYSLVDVIDPIQVSFFMGNPLWDGVLQSDINGETLFTLNGGIPAQGFRTLSMTWIAPADNQLIGRLYAQIDPNNELSETHEENNIGYLPLGIYYLNDNEVNVSEYTSNKIQGLMCYPNPAQERVNLAFHNAMADEFMIEVYDMQGRLSKTYPFSQLPQGFQERSIDVSDLPKGVYVLKLTNDRISATTKMVID